MSGLVDAAAFDMTSVDLSAPGTESLDAAYARGMKLQLAGKIDSAGEIYREILQEAPRHAAVNYCYGLLQVQAGRPLEGLPYLKRALLEQLGVADYWLGYLEALLLAGRTDLARNILGLARQQGLADAAFEEISRRLELVAQRQPLTVAGAPVAPRSLDAAPFIVLAPAFRAHSAGIRVLHALCNELNELGRTAYLMFYRFLPDNGIDLYVPDGDAEYCKLYTSIPRLAGCSDLARYRDLIDSAYVIYPEVVPGNPLNARSVVRYVLNSPAANGYPMREDKDDYIVAFSRNFWPKPQFVATMVFEDPLFDDRDSRPAAERTMDCTYIGKGATFGDCFKIQDSVLIERNWPADKESLAIMLRNTRYLYTWDLISQTNVDALMCGAIPVVVRWAPFSAAVFDGDFGPFPHAELTVKNGAVTVTYEPKPFDERRRRYIDSYRALARTRIQMTSKLVIDIDRHFEHVRQQRLESDNDGILQPTLDSHAPEVRGSIAAQGR